MISTPTFPNVPQKLVLYVLPVGSSQHKALAIRRMTKNAKGRYITGDQIGMWGLFWPQIGWAATRDELAMKIGQQILDEAGV